MFIVVKTAHIFNQGRGRNESQNTVRWSSWYIGCVATTNIYLYNSLERTVGVGKLCSIIFVENILSRNTNDSITWDSVDASNATVLYDGSGIFQWVNATCMSSTGMVSGTPRRLPRVTNPIQSLQNEIGL